MGTVKCLQEMCLSRQNDDCENDCETRILMNQTEASDFSVLALSCKEMSKM